MPIRDLLKLYLTYGLLIVGAILLCIPETRWYGAILLGVVVLLGAYFTWRGDRNDDR